jgi:hypothetical protein
MDRVKFNGIRIIDRNREYSKGKKTVPGKVATTHTENGHK